MSDLYFNEEIDYSEGNTCDKEVFCSTILQLFQLELEQKKTSVVRAMKKKLNILVHASAADFTYSKSKFRLV